MPLYQTNYTLPSGRVDPTQCYAESDEHLVEVIALRSMGETRADPVRDGIYVPKMASALMFDGRIAAANHALVWTSMIAARAGLTEAWDLLNDEGILHRVAHELEQDELDRRGILTISSFFGGSKQDRREALARRIEAFERLVPGVHPCWAGDDKRSIVDIKAEERRLAQAQVANPVLSSMFDLSAIAHYRQALDSFASRAKTINAGMQIIVDEVQNIKTEAAGAEVLARAKDAPRAKHDSRKFAEHQRNQGQAVRDAKKADLVARMQKNLSGEARHETATLKLVKETQFGVTPTGNIDDIRPKGRSIHSAMYGKDATLSVGGKEVGIVKGSLSISNPVKTLAEMITFDIATTDVMIGIDLAGPGVKDTSMVMGFRPYQRKAVEAIRSGAITGRMTSNEPVFYHMTQEGPPIRMIGGEGADEEDRRRLDSIVMETLARKNQDAITRIIMGTFANG